MDWNEWRKQYDSLSWTQQKAFHSTIEQAHPEQQHFTRLEALRFVAGLPAGSRILEIGGWKGEMAQFCLPDAPGVHEWLNIEVLPEARQHVVSDSRYKVRIPKNFIWKVGMPTGYDALIMSHTIEHMRGHELAQIVEQFDGSDIYFEAPLDDPSRVNGWDGYPGTHILEMGWEEVDFLLAANCFVLTREETGASHNTKVKIYHRRA